MLESYMQTAAYNARLKVENSHIISVQRSATDSEKFVHKKWKETKN